MHTTFMRFTMSFASYHSSTIIGGFRSISTQRHWIPFGIIVTWVAGRLFWTSRSCWETKRGHGFHGKEVSFFALLFSSSNWLGTYCLSFLHDMKLVGFLSTTKQHEHSSGKAVYKFVHVACAHVVRPHLIFRIQLKAHQAPTKLVPALSNEKR